MLVVRDVVVPPGLVVDRLVDATVSGDLGSGEVDDCLCCRAQECALVLYALGLAVLDVAAVDVATVRVLAALLANNVLLRLALALGDDHGDGLDPELEDQVADAVHVDLARDAVGSAVICKSTVVVKSCVPQALADRHCGV